jgi:hypothetical protein
MRDRLYTAGELLKLNQLQPQPRNIAAPLPDNLSPGPEDYPLFHEEC